MTSKSYFCRMLPCLSLWFSSPPTLPCTFIASLRPAKIYELLYPNKCVSNSNLDLRTPRRFVDSAIVDVVTFDTDTGDWRERQTKRGRMDRDGGSMVSEVGQKRKRPWNVVRQGVIRSVVILAVRLIYLYLWY